MPSEAISWANCEKSGLVRQDIGQNSKTMNMTQGPYANFFTMKTSLSPSRVNPYLGAMVPCGGRCRTFNYKGMSATCPYLSVQFLQKYFSRNQIFPLIHKSDLRYTSVVEASVPMIILFSEIRKDVGNLDKWLMFWHKGLHLSQILHAKPACKIWLWWRSLGQNVSHWYNYQHLCGLH